MTDESQEQADEGVLDENIRRELREGRNERARLEAELEAMRRDHAFTKAGVPEDGAGALFRKAYDGELDPEAMKSAAQGYGLDFAKPAEPQIQQVPDEELAAHQRIAGANVGASHQGTGRAAVLAELAQQPDEASVIDFVRRTVQEGRDPGGMFQG